MATHSGRRPRPRKNDGDPADEDGPKHPGHSEFQLLQEPQEQESIFEKQKWNELKKIHERTKLNSHPTGNPWEHPERKH